MSFPSRRQFFAGAAAAPPALMIADVAHGSGRHRLNHCASDACGSPIWEPAACCDSTLVHCYEWGWYTFSFPFAREPNVATARLDFVDCWRRRIRGTLTARSYSPENTPPAIFYRNGRLYVKGQIDQHTVHSNPGVADVFLTLNGCPRPTTKSCRPVCYLYHQLSHAPCLDPELQRHFTAGNNYDAEQPMTFPCQFTDPVRQVKLDFFHRLNTGGNGELRGTLLSNSVDFFGGELIVTGQLVNQGSMTFNAAANISITVTDGEGTVTNPPTVCYRRQ
jgi:hypothetical protein